MSVERAMTQSFVSRRDVDWRGIGVVVGRGLIVLLVLAFAAAVADFALVERPIEFALPARAPFPQGRANVAAAEFGPTVRASSAFADPSFQHHPAFVVDGRRKPTRREKWVSREDDPAPWLEILFARPVHLESVVLTHGGAVERSDYTADAYQIRCIRADGQPGASVSVEGNRLAKVTHPLDCSNAGGVRLEFTPREKAGNMVRVYEVEAFGR